MTIGFLILAHKNANQCLNLIDSLLHYKKAYVYVHVDLKADVVNFKLLETYKNNPRVEIINSRYKVYWGSYNQILATLALIQQSNKNKLLNYFCLLSAQDFPIKPLQLFANFLAENNGTEFMVNFKLPDKQWDGEGGLNRLNFYWRNQKNKQKNFLSDKLDSIIYYFHKISGFRRKLKYTYYGGSNWFILTHHAIYHITEFIKNNPGYLKEYKHSRCADEMFIQSILLNSEFKNKVIAYDLRYVDWKSGPDFPKVFVTYDFEKLISLENKFFARKFDEIIDAEILVKLKKYIE